MLSPIIRLSVYVVLAATTPPIVGAYDYGSNGVGGGSIWTQLIVSVVLAAVIAAIGEAGLRIARHLRRH